MALVLTLKQDVGSLTYRVGLPDTKAEDLDVSVSEGVVTIRGERQHERRLEREGYEWREISHSSFTRRLPLPQTADWERAKASLDDGFLEITVPKSEPGEPRFIQVNRAPVDEPE